MPQKPENIKRKAQKVVDNNGSTPLAQLDAILELGDKMDDLKKSMPKTLGLEGAELVTIKGAKGDKGDKGDRGEKGDQGKAGKDGRDGKDGKNGTDGKNGINGVDGPAGLPGKDGKDGKDAIIPDVKALIIDTVNYLETREGEDRLDAKAIKNLPQFTREIVHETGVNFRAGAMETPLKDASTGLPIPKDASGAWLVGSGDAAFDSHRPTTRSGIPVVTVNGDTVVEFLEGYFFPPQGPQVSLSTNPSGGLRESGNAVTSVDLTPTTTAGSLPITSLDLAGTDGFSYSYPSPNPSGGVEATQTDGTGFSTNNSYTATVSDGTNSDTDTVTFTFISAYYYGVANPGLDISSDGGGLTKLLIPNTASVTQSFSPTFPQVYYFAYPASYPVLTSILDKNGFETISDYTVSTVMVTNSFGSTVNYRLYEFNNGTTQVNFNNTFIQ